MAPGNLRAERWTYALAYASQAIWLQRLAQKGLFSTQTGAQSFLHFIGETSVPVDADIP